VVAALLLVFAALVGLRTNLRALHMAILPLIAILLLAVAGLTNQLNISDQLLMFFVFLLYMAAAIIALVTLTAISHAGEFSSDLVFTLAILLFAAASVLGQGVAELIDIETVNLVTILVTMLYAIASTLVFYLRWFRERPWEDPGNSEEHEQRGARKAASALGQMATENRCAVLAQEHQLTARELEILEMLALGHRGPFISEALFISPNTVRTHIHNIYRKLAVNSREDILRITHQPPSPPPPESNSGWQ